MEIQKTRAVAPFFEDAINQIFMQPKKTFYVMDGAIGLGKSSNWLMWGAYQIAQCVKPIKKNNRLVRESLWAGIRESENSAQATFMQLLEGAIFSPEIMAMDNSPVKIMGTHPSYIVIEHDLPDGTLLEMKIECHGFNNDAALNRLKSREYLGALIPEMQGIPYSIFKTAGERCGRWRTQNLEISKEIDGKVYRLTGLDKLKMVLADVNIPERPHPMYKEYYDVPDKSSLPHLFITPPPPLKHVLVKDLPDDKRDALLAKYPTSKFEGKKVMWYPNKEAYNMTRHFEEIDDDGNPIPWTGFSLWYKELYRTDSEVRRYVIGIPDTVGGLAAIYPTFNKEAATRERIAELAEVRTIWVGYDPGGYAAIVAMKRTPQGGIHVIKEFIFTPVDAASTRVQFSDFFLPFMRENFPHHHIIIVLDPASSWLGKSIMTGQTESVKNMVTDELGKEKLEHPESGITYAIQPCMVMNQDTTARINGLGYYIDQEQVTMEPDCDNLSLALSGGYQRKKLKSGVISDSIDKDNPYSHSAEALQYPVVNILTAVKKAKNGRQNSSKRGAYRVRRPSR